MAILGFIQDEMVVTIVSVLFDLIVGFIMVSLYPRLKAIAKKKEEAIEAALGKERYATLKLFVTEAIEYVEDKYKDSFEKMGEQKKAEVVEYLNKNGFSGVSMETIDMIIDNAVKQMNRTRTETDVAKG